MIAFRGMAFPSALGGGARWCQTTKVTTVARLVTHVDVRDDDSDAERMSVSARLEAELADGRSVLLLDGRGWTAARMQMRVAEAAVDAAFRDDAQDIWAATSVEEIEQHARYVVGPDEPFAGYTRDELETGHWAFLSDVLRQQGVVADARALRGLPHDVALSERLLARLGQPRPGA
jgi:hypothetical protein